MHCVCAPADSQLDPVYTDVRTQSDGARRWRLRRRMNAPLVAGDQRPMTQLSVTLFIPPFAFVFLPAPPSRPAATFRQHKTTGHISCVSAVCIRDYARRFELAFLFVFLCACLHKVYPFLCMCARERVWSVCHLPLWLGTAIDFLLL